MFTRNVFPYSAIILAPALLALAGLAHAQGIVPAKGNVDLAIKRAKAETRPLFLYVPESRADEKDKGNVKDAIWRALADKRVETLVNQRFVCAKLHLNNANQPLRAKFGVGSMEGVVVTPDGTLLKKFTQAEMCNVGELLSGLTHAYRSFRDKLYESRWKPDLQDRGSAGGKLLTALAGVRHYLILNADKDVVALLDRPLEPHVRKDVCLTLRTLSTPASAQALLQHALTDEDAKHALGKCLPAALDDLAGAMNSAFDARHVAAYEACCRILKSTPQPAHFWTGPKVEKIKRAERDRIATRARQAAREFDNKFGRFR